MEKNKCKRVKAKRQAATDAGWVHCPRCGAGVKLHCSPQAHMGGQCNRCGFVTDSLEERKKRHFPEEHYGCEICDIISMSVEEAQKHNEKIYEEESELDVESVEESE